MNLSISNFKFPLFLWAKIFYFIMLLVVVLPFIILGKDSYFIVHDSLDSTFYWFSSVAKPDRMFNHNAIIPEIMGVIPRSLLSSPFNIALILFYTFGDFLGYIINSILVRSIGYFSVIFLLNELDTKNHPFNNIITIFLALIWSLLPFYTIYGASVTALPFVLLGVIYAIKKRQKLFMIAIAIMYPLYSSLFGTGFFVITLLLFFYIYHIYQSKFITKIKVNNTILLYIVLITITYLVSQYMLFISLLTPGFVSHRVTRGLNVIINNLSFRDCLRHAWHLMIQGHYHPGTALKPFALFALAFFPISFFTKKTRYIFHLRFWFALFIILNIIASFFSWRFFYPIKEIIPVLKYTAFNRFYWLSGAAVIVMIYFYIMHVSSLIKTRFKPLFFVFIILLCLAQLSYQFNAPGFKKEISTNWVYVYNKIFTGIVPEHRITYKRFFDSKLFDLLKKGIGYDKDKHRVISVAMHPAVTIFNGINSADGYLVNYPKEYHESFYRMIKPELLRDKKIHNYFFNWGNRCYAFSSEIRRKFLINKNSKKAKKLITLNYNWEQAKKLGITHVLSTVKIINNNGLEYINSFTTEESYRVIHVYKLR